MEKKIGYFTTAFRDGRVYIAGESCPAGYFSTYLLNQYYINDTAARLSAFRQHNWHLSDMLTAGYVGVSELEQAGIEIGHLLDNIPLLQPFTFMDIDGERNRIKKLFTKENGKLIASYFYRRGKVGQIDADEAALDLLPPEYDKELFCKAEKMLSEISSVLHLYDSLGDDVKKAYMQLKAFVSRIDEASRFDEAHLLPIAYEIFGQVPFSLKTEYVPIRKSSRSKELVTARQLYFESYYSFIITDFFEGLHFGYYPRRCEVCKRYFLMQSARKQKYCNGYSDEYLKDKRLTCRKVGAMRKQAEAANDNPVKALCKNRCGCIRVEKSRGVITPEFAEAAINLAIEHRYTALQKPEYAKKQYALDMAKDKLYQDTAERLKK